MATIVFSGHMNLRMKLTDNIGLYFKLGMTDNGVTGNMDIALGHITLKQTGFFTK